MTRKRCRALVTIGFGLLLGCDNFDPSALLPKISDAQGEGQAAGEAIQEGSNSGSLDGTPTAAKSPGPRDPEMQSIGPESSQRIYYQFVDDRGRVQFVERLSEVPPAWRDRVGYVEMDRPPPLTPIEARRSWKLSADRTAEILLAAAGPSTSRSQNSDVILYSAEWCGYCQKARSHLDRAGVDYELRDVDNGAIARELREKTGRGGVPVLDFTGQILRGYSSDAYERAIRTIQG